MHFDHKITEHGKARLAQELSNHAQEECELYMLHHECEEIKDQLSLALECHLIMHTTLLNRFLYHITLNKFGSLYFIVCRIILLFGVCCDGNRKQVNYLIASATMGANTWA